MMSKLEHMAYKMQPAGHEEKEPKRQYAEPDKRLVHAFEDWCQRCEVMLSKHSHTSRYDVAYSIVDKLETSVAEAHGLLMRCQDDLGERQLDNVGYFLSAVYNKTKEKEIIYDLDGIEPFNLGFNLSKDKILISKAKTGDYLGQAAEGIVINYSETGDSMCNYAKGVALNFGRAGTNGPQIRMIGGDMGGASHGLVINLGNAGNGLGPDAYGTILNLGNSCSFVGYNAKGIVVDVEKMENVELAHTSKLLIDRNDYDHTPKLRKYLDALKEKLLAGKTDYKLAVKAIEELGPNPSQTIQKEIRQAFGWPRYLFRRVIQRAQAVIRYRWPFD